MPLNVISDIHSCYLELLELFDKLNYIWEDNLPIPPPNRTTIFVGDIMDRGPHSLKTFLLVKRMIASGRALSVVGNHCDKLMRWALGKNVVQNHGLDKTIKELESNISKEEIANYIKSLPYYIHIENTIITHAGWRDSFITKDPFSKELRSYCLYGPTTGELDGHGLPERIDWASKRFPKADDPVVVYGHQPYRDVRVINKTYGIDMGVCFGGYLTCLKIPELEIVSVKAHKEYENLEGRFK